MPPKPTKKRRPKPAGVRWGKLHEIGNNAPIDSPMRWRDQFEHAQLLSDAVVDGKAVTPERKHSNHMFYGPGYSIAHPGVFPQNIKADRIKSFRGFSLPQ